MDVEKVDVSTFSPALHTSATSGGAVCAQQEKMEKDEIRAVLERMWTEVIVRSVAGARTAGMLTYSDLCSQTPMDRFLQETVL